MPIRIRTLGPLSFEADGKELPELLERPVRAAVLVLLAVERELSREQLLGLLWPDSSPDHARHALNQILYVVRRDLGPDLLAADGDRLRATAALEIDVQDFRDAVGGTRWEEALRLYGGAFLEGWYLADSHPFEEWVEQQRASLRRTLRQALRGAIRQRLDASDPGAALDSARRWLALDPLEDEAHHRVIELHATLGDRAGALERFEEYRRLLAKEELTPLEATVALVAAIRGRTAAPARAVPPESAVREVSPAEAVPPEAPAPDSARKETETAQPASGATATRSPAPGATRWHRGWIAAMAAALVLGAGLTLPRLLRRSAGPPPLIRNRVLVAPFDNETGDSTLNPVGQLAADWILTLLGDAAFLEIVPREVARAPAPSGTEAAPGAATAGATTPLGIALANHAGLLLTGRYYRRGPDLEFHASLVDTRTGELLDALGPVRSDTSDAMQALGVLGQRVKIALALRLEARLSGMFTRATRPPTYDAFRAYADGMGSFVRGNWVKTIANMRAARTLAPDFVAPLIFEGFAYLSAGDRTRADSVATLAYRQRDGLVQYDRLRLDILRASIAGDLQGEYDAAREAARIQPGGSAHFVAGNAALRLGRPREALRILADWDPYREGVRPFTPYWRVVTEARHVLGQHEEELERSQEARRRIPNRLEPLWYEARALAALGRARPLGQLLDESESMPAGALLPGHVLVLTAEELAAHGYAGAARETADRALAWLGDRVARTPADASARWWMAWALVLAGRDGEASRLAAAVAREHPDSVAFLGLVCALGARAAPRDTAEACDRRLASWGEPAERAEAKLWRARIAAARGEPERALQLLQQSFAEGLPFGSWLHSDVFLAPLRAARAFQSLVQPTG